MIAERTEIKFACADCGQRISVDAAGAGMVVTCPGCTRSLVIPQVASLLDRAYGASGRTAPRRTDSFSSGETNGPALRELREELAVAERERGVAIASLEMVRRENAALVERIGRLSTECGQRVADGVAAAHQLAQRQLELAAATKGAAQLSADLSTREKEVREMRARLAASEAAVLRAREELAAVASQNAQWQKKLAAALGTQDAEALRAALAAAEEKLAAEQSARAAAETQRKLQAGQCLLLQDEIARLRADLGEGHAGRELLALRDRFEVLEGKHLKATAALGELERAQEAQLTVGQQLRSELAVARECAAVAENRAEASSESALGRDLAVLRGIIVRQKAELEERRLALHRLQNARLYLRFAYAVFAVAFLVVVVLVFLHPPELVQVFLRAWFGS